MPLAANLFHCSITIRYTKTLRKRAGISDAGRCWWAMKQNMTVIRCLSSPIILYDYPKVAAESAGDLFDSTEIDEILSLRIKTMTDEEKLEMRNIDEHARRILERTEKLSAEHLMQMHGTLREVRASNQDFFNPAQKIQSANVRGVDLKKGDRVRIRPKKRADIMDMAWMERSGSSKLSKRTWSTMCTLLSFWRMTLDATLEWIATSDIDSFIQRTKSSRFEGDRPILDWHETHSRRRHRKHFFRR